ncbi:isochorismate synthase [Psychrobacillus sp. AK 1817]|uniref:isochorismate synthase n=1 Tax=Psychrobacillus sp. AK 1817 TaxID=2303505 RepID=UPI001245A818|nr:isochorismate synthase [Psychrobacillus sp. AK 1817]QEY22579.1 isochorismate synthase [Psychrobacillus sp. AK 1817]
MPNTTGQNKTTLRFYTETIEVSRMSAHAFFEAGEDCYKGKRFFWQNKEKTFTLVGLGHAYVLANDLEKNRYQDIAQKWEELCACSLIEKADVSPILFGGFSFDPANKISSEWNSFPSSFFAVATFQLVIRDDQAFVSIHLITEEQDSSAAFEHLRIERDTLIHTAQVKELKVHEKPQLLQREDRLKDEYLSAVEAVTNRIRNKEVNKVVIGRSLKLTFENSFSSSTAIYNASMEQPESYLFGLEKEDKIFFGATPERLVKLEKGKVESAGLAGSVRRGTNLEEDKKLGDALLADNKNLMEHQYVVSMIRKVFDQYCEQVKIPSRPKLMKIRDIQHLFTPIEGKIKGSSSLFEFVEAMHPTPALGGEPRQEAIEIIRESEQMNRGYYAAPIGWVNAEGEGEFAVGIRSALIENQYAYLYAGGGLVSESTSLEEFEETRVKFRPMLRTLGGNMND